MKKNLLMFALCVILFLLVVPQIFGQEQLEINIGEEWRHSNSIKIASFSSGWFSLIVGFTGIHYFTKTFGLFLNINFNFPIIGIAEYGGSTFKTTVWDDVLFIGLGGLIGPVINIKTTDSFNIPISFGLHFLRMATVENGGGISVGYYGIGINIGFEINISKTIYASFKILGFFDFINKNNHQNIYEVSHDNTHFDYHNWGIQPTIGLGKRL